MISAIAWVPAGVADPSPKRYELSAAETEILAMIEDEEKEQANNMQGGGSANNDNNKIKNVSKETRKRGTMKVLMAPAALASDLPADLRMDEYSDDDGEDQARSAISRIIVNDNDAPDDDEQEAGEEAGDEDENEKRPLQEGDDDGDDDDDDDDDDNLSDVPDTREYTPLDVGGLQAMGLCNVGLGSGADLEDMDYGEDDSDAEDVKLTEDDAIILVTKTEDDFSALEVHVYDQKRGNLYVHHDIPLPSFPLCLAHGQVNSDGGIGNYCAVGTFDTGIEIWNLDVLNALEPSCILGGEDVSTADLIMKRQIMGGGKIGVKKAMEPASLRSGSHTDAVMALSWNSIHKQVVASGSADKTVKLWDVTQASSDATGKCNAATFHHHRGKVQSVVWHPKEGTLLATGSYDRTVALLDARSNGDNTKSVKIPADCEVVAWDPFHPEHIVVGTEDGTISCWDVRKFQTSTPLWTMVTSEFGGLSDLSFSPHVPGLFATCSVDKTVTLWDAYHDGGPAENMPPRPCGSKDMCAGKLYSVAFYDSAPLLLGCGGSGNILSLWNLEDEDAIKKNFADRLGGSTDGANDSGDSSSNQVADLEAMMADRAELPSNTNKGKKNKKKGKRKAHKRGG